MSSTSPPIEAEIRIEIAGNTVEVKEITTNEKEKCDDNCDICREAEARTKLANSSKLRRRRAQRARRKERQMAEKAARLEKAKLDLELEAPGGSLGAKSRENTSKSQHTTPQPSVPAKQGVRVNEGEITNTATLPPHIVEVVTIDDSSESEEESEFIRVLRKFGSFY